METNISPFVSLPLHYWKNRLPFIDTSSVHGSFLDSIKKTYYTTLPRFPTLLMNSQKGLNKAVLKESTEEKCQVTPFRKGGSTSRPECSLCKLCLGDIHSKCPQGNQVAGEGKTYAHGRYPAHVSRQLDQPGGLGRNGGT